MLAAAAFCFAALAVPPQDVTAVGVVVSPREQVSVAILKSGSTARIVAVGESAFGGRILAIAPEGVSIDFGGERVLLRLPGALAAPAPASAAGKASPPAANDSANLFMARAEVERRISDEAPRLLAETALQPVTEEGRITGFALTRVPPNSLLSEAGLEAGDVLVRVNDVPIDSLATLMGLYPRLQNESLVQAVVLRNGQPLTLTLHLR
jgi:type II secretion system protein C